jgi:hypothetical protein
MNGGTGIPSGRKGGLESHAGSATMSGMSPGERALAADWGGQLADADIELLASACGVKVPAAQALIPRMSAIDIPFERAMAVFRNITCLDSWDHVPIRSWPLFKARNVLRTLFQSDLSLATR